MESKYQLVESKYQLVESKYQLVESKYNVAAGGRVVSNLVAESELVAQYELTCRQLIELVPDWVALLSDR